MAAADEQSTGDLRLRRGRLGVGACSDSPRRARETHGLHDENWPDWYTEFTVREQAGRD
jgi:hypothetical protein